MSTISIHDSVGDFAGDKDAAARLRETRLRPAVAAGEQLTIDFARVDLATQSFIHALISELVRQQDVDALQLITFTNCNPSVRELIEIVVEYSQDDVAEPDAD